MITKLSPNRRCFHGYHQHTEEFTIDGKTVKRWMFYVPWFSSDNKYAHVKRSDGHDDIVPIDDQDRILILGRRYGPRHWNH